ncbi:MAG: hypothetical protein MUC50_14875 [Myxococcota bacterium]|nr:hypothetical protein [Myxococcota bacterium]
MDNGSELFGPTTGDGFVELSAHDDDSSGWIDEADAVYDQLSVWTGRADAADTLRSLRQANVGAIALLSAKTPYTPETPSGEEAAVVPCHVGVPRRRRRRWHGAADRFSALER